MVRRNKRGGRSYRKLLTGLLLIGLLIVLTDSMYVAYRLVAHEKYQDTRLQKLESELALLREEANQTSVEWSEDSFNYLAIGNSVTSHGLADYWWNDGTGMAASCADKDYVHLIADTLPKPCEVHAYNFSVWEIQSYDRAETLALLDGYLSDRLDLITLQLSENVVELDTFEKDYEELICYIKKKTPNAQLVVIDDFWDDGEKSQMKQNATANEAVDFASLAEIKGDSAYQAGLGTVVYDQDGNTHVIEHEGVAHHPGDKGMTYIARAVEAVIRQQSTGYKERS